MEKTKTSIIWKMSYRRAKRSEIWESRVVFQYIQGTFGIVASKVILRSFGALAIFFENTISEKHYLFNKSQPNLWKLLLNYLLNGPQKTTVETLEIFKIQIVTIFFSFSLTWEPIGVKISKWYSYKSQPNVFRLVLNFPPNKTTLGIFESLGFRFLTIFIGKTSDSRAKRNEI